MTEKRELIEDLKKVKAELDSYRDVLKKDEINPIFEVIEEIEDKLNLPKSTEDALGTSELTPTSGKVISDYEKLKKIIDRLLKLKIDVPEDKPSFATFVHQLLHNTDKLNFKKTIKIWEDIEFVNGSLKNIIKNSSKSKYIRKLSKFSSLLDRYCSVANIRADTIKSYKKHAEESKKRSQQYLLDIYSKRSLFDLNVNNIADYLNIKKPEKGFKKGLEGMNKLNKNTNQYKMYQGHYAFRQRMFDYWKRFYNINYEDLIDDIKKIIKLIEKIDYLLIKSEEKSRRT